MGLAVFLSMIPRLWIPYSWDHTSLIGEPWLGDVPDTIDRVRVEHKPERHVEFSSEDINIAMDGVGLISLQPVTSETDALHTLPRLFFTTLYADRKG